MKSHVLLLASSSKSRQILLQEALIPFEVLGHDADEDSVDKTLPFKDLLQEIAREKMKHALLPKRGQEGQYVYVLAADSMGYDAQGIVHGKPKDKADAIAKLKSLGEQATTATAFCLDRIRSDIGGHHYWLRRYFLCLCQRRPGIYADHCRTNTSDK